MVTRFAKLFFLTALLFLAVPGADAAEKLVADYGGHAGFQSATWIGRDLRIFEKHGLDVEIVMITGAARSVAALLGNSTHFATGSATGFFTWTESPSNMTASGGSNEPTPR